MTNKEYVKNNYPRAYIWILKGVYDTWHNVVSYSEDGKGIEFWGWTTSSPRGAWESAYRQIQQEFLRKLIE